MSYDLAVFSKKGPKAEDAFLKWFEALTQWDKSHDYDSFDSTAPELKDWLLDIFKKFPPMNSRYTPLNFEADYLADYTIGADMIYVAFPLSKSKEAYDNARELAIKHKTGFFNVSSESLEIEYNY